MGMHDVSWQKHVKLAKKERTMKRKHSSETNVELSRKRSPDIKFFDHYPRIKRKDDDIAPSSFDIGCDEGIREDYDGPREDHDDHTYEEEEDLLTCGDDTHDRNHEEDLNEQINDVPGLHELQSFIDDNFFINAILDQYDTDTTDDEGTKMIDDASLDEFENCSEYFTNPLCFLFPAIIMLLIP